MNNSFLNDIKSFSKNKLKPTSTKISYTNGKQFLIESKNGEEIEILDDNQTQTSSNSVYWSKHCGYLVDLIPDLSIDEIIPRLYLSGDDVATNKEILKSKNITHILNLTSNIPNKFENEFCYKKILIYDLPEQEIFKYFNESFQFIDNALNENESNSVLVHCNAGVSRSSSFVIAYLIQKRISKTYQEAFEIVKKHRSKICPNNGFVKQLVHFESFLNQE